jgi:hypothetical protein
MRFFYRAVVSHSNRIRTGSPAFITAGSQPGSPSAANHDPADVEVAIDNFDRDLLER